VSTVNSYNTSYTSNTAGIGSLITSISNSTKTPDTLLNSPMANLRIHKASGGFVIEVLKYTQDFLTKSRLYVADETNLGSQVEKIIMLECLRGDSETQ
jgi:hypothetical protein